MNHASTPSLSAAARLDIDVMRSFVAIAESRAINTAAVRVGRTPAAISMQIKKLEGILGASLFTRSRSGMGLTPAGERLLPHARRMLEAERAAREAMMEQLLTGHVRIGLIEDVGGVRLADTLAAYAHSHADVVVEVIISSTATLGAMLEEGRLDLAVFTPGGSVNLHPDDEILHEEPLYWAVRKGSDLWQRRPVPLAVYAEGCAWRRTTVEALDGAGIPYRVAYQSDNYGAQIAAVMAGLAVAPLPRSQFTCGLRAITAEEGAPPLNLARVALRFGSNPSEAALILGQRIAEQFKGEAASGPLVFSPGEAAAALQ